MVTVEKLIDALYRCDKSAPVPINLDSGGSAWISDIKILETGTVVLIAHVAKEETNE